MKLYKIIYSFDNRGEISYDISLLNNDHNFFIIDEYILERYHFISLPNNTSIIDIDHKFDTVYENLIKSIVIAETRDKKINKILN